MTGHPRTPVRVLIVDDHPVVREGLRSMLKDEAVELAGEAATGGDALRQASEVRADVVLLDMQLPDLDGLVVLRQLRHLAPEAAVLILTMHDEVTLVRDAISAGASGYVLKGIGRQELLAAVLAARGGESVVDPTLLRAAFRPATPGASTLSTVDALSPVELELLRLIARGMTNRKISEEMRWSISTVKKYARRIYEKLGVTDRTEATAVALRRRLLE